jgi:tellurite resistance protein TehA-like permease
MILPGLISFAFYKRRPSTIQVSLGLLATVALSAILGYFSPGGPLGRNGSIVVAIVGGVILYFGILAFLFYRFRHLQTESPKPTSPSVPP